VANIKDLVGELDLETLKPTSPEVGKTPDPTIDKDKVLEVIGLIQSGGSGDGIPIHMKACVTKEQCNEVRREMQARIAELTPAD
jgi:hypothetical protein